MKNLVKFALLGFIAWLFTACGSKYAITYATNPSGANIICNGVGQGFSPLTLYYDLSVGKKEGWFDNDNGVLTTAPCKAVFISGYVDYFGNKWDTKKFPNGVTRTLTRPQGEGYAQDMEFSMQYEMQSQAVAAAKAQAKAAQQQANQAAYDSINNSFQQNQQNLQNQQRNFQLQQMNNNLQQINRTLRGY